MKHNFRGWSEVEKKLRIQTTNQDTNLNDGQRDSLHCIADRISTNGVIIADEVGMGKTRIAVQLAHSVIKAGGRVAILIPPGLGYQWQDELRNGGCDAPEVLRSAQSFLKPWETKQEKNYWFKQDLVLLSHSFTNWRLGESAEVWRWSLLPEIYAHWRKRNTGSLPRFYNTNNYLTEDIVRFAAENITMAIPEACNHPANLRACELSEQTPWPGALTPKEYSRDQDTLRPLLERAFGLGLGVFDLVIIDEAHKSRGSQSGLSRLIDSVVLQSTEGRRLAMTATPVELDVDQWWDILSRVGIEKVNLAYGRESQDNPLRQYAQAVNNLRQKWSSSPEALAEYKEAAANFQAYLAPYLLRRDKREDPEIKLFEEKSQLPICEYRKVDNEIKVETSKLSSTWQQAICAAEALSLVTRHTDLKQAKRLRLTLGNGHGIATVLGKSTEEDPSDEKQEEEDESVKPVPQKVESQGLSDSKRQGRIEWWLNTIERTFSEGSDALLNHPAILAAVTAIENATNQGEKVLVFGRFTSPLNALTDLLNSREMLRRIYHKPSRPWPQSKVHGSRHGNLQDSNWPAVRAAYCQLAVELGLEPLDDTKEQKLDEILKIQYEQLEYQRQKFRDSLIDNLERGFEILFESGRLLKSDKYLKAFEALKRLSTANSSNDLALVSRVLFELIGYADTIDSYEPNLTDLAQTFLDLMVSAGGKDDSDADANGDGQIDEDEADKLWSTLKDRLAQEYNRSTGGFARVMNGNTPHPSRRMLQLGFNRKASEPRILVAQSMVGREGLNLHKSCRIVVLLHPEWNPGVVEQQIGRVDRVGSHWSKQLTAAIKNGVSGEELPRIEVWPVIFCGTYDEHNWKVLRERWEDLRAQLHGVVIPPGLANDDPDFKLLIDEITKGAPNFSPSKLRQTEILG